ncbi:hypothetical protein [Jatrophihabitans sp.]|jgi:hypothetical protein|uniref:hypothetical protein n=1 Tax=Jatrophihabitans sp. TaxID=1932789 RepID=UPI002F25A75B
MEDLAALLLKLRTWVYLIILSAVLITRSQMSSLLGKIASSGATPANMDVLTRPQAGLGVLQNAVSTWNSSGQPDLARKLIQGSIVTDVALMALYGVLLARFLRWCRRDRPDSTWRVYIPLIVALIADLCENVASLRVSNAVHDGPSPSLPSWAAWTVVIATWVKWAGLAATLTSCLALRLADPGVSDRADYDDMTPTDKFRAHIEILNKEHPVPDRVWTRLRVQMMCVALFFVLIAVPLKAPLDQVPDTIRNVADGDQRIGNSFMQELLLLLPIVVLLCPAIWAVGRLALLDLYCSRPRRTPARTPRQLLVLASVFTAVYGIVSWSVAGTDAQLTAGGFAMPLVAGVMLAVSWLVTGSPPWSTRPANHQDKVDVPFGQVREKVRAASLILTVLPLAAFGLGVIRAFLLASLLDPSTLYILLTISGFVISIGGSTFSFYAMEAFERHVLKDEEIEEADTQCIRLGVGVGPMRPYPMYMWLPITLLALLAIVLAYAMVRLGLDPFTDPFTGKSTAHGVGIISVFLATIVLVSGVAQYRAEVRAPMQIFDKMQLKRSPVIGCCLVVLMAAGFLGGSSSYHDVRFTDAAVPVATTSWDDEVVAWGEQAIACAGGRRLPDGSIPMLFVAAPGGGIRAAYWTDHALARIQRAPCGKQWVFAASGVSGGSLGLAARYAPVSSDGTPAPATRYPSTDLATEAALAANTASDFFRDLPAFLIGVDHAWDDRAAVLERSWEMTYPPLAKGFYSAMRPGVVGMTDKYWRPIIVFNGTEVDTGCRLLVSPMRLAATDVTESVWQCRGDQIRTEASALVPAALDAQDFSARSMCPEGTAVEFSIATAVHLSARFPYVSPTGTLRGCRAGGKEIVGNNTVAIADSDGGANENSGIDTLLAVWRAVSPAVARFPGTHHGVRLTPVLVVLRNGYLGTGPLKKTRPSPQLMAPGALLGAKKLGVDEQVLLERAQFAFGENVYLVAPKDGPTVQAPLGWMLSRISQGELDRQLDDLSSDDSKNTCTRIVGRPSALRCLLDLLGPS